jgi:hypothetical protein
MRLHFVPVAGDVISRNDGQTHFISAGKLVQLYGMPRAVLPLGCHRANQLPRWGGDEAMNRAFAWLSPWSVPLTPRFDGDYSLIKAVMRWAPFALTAFRERLVRAEAKLANSLQHCADLGARLDAFEGRRRP